MSTLLEHPNHYFHIQLRDDYLAVYEGLAEILDPYKPEKKKSAASDCKAMIAAILERWMESRSQQSKNERDWWLYLTIDEWEQRLRYRYKRNVIIQCLHEMSTEGVYVDEEGTVQVGTILKVPYIQNTFKYLLNLSVMKALLECLPEESPYEQKPKPHLGRPSKSSLKINGLNSDGISEESCLEINGITESSLKKDGITAKNGLKINASFYTQITGFTDYGDSQITKEGVFALAQPPAHTLSQLESEPPVTESENDNHSYSHQGLYMPSATGLSQNTQSLDIPLPFAPSNGPIDDVTTRNTEGDDHHENTRAPGFSPGTPTRHVASMAHPGQPELPETVPARPGGDTAPDRCDVALDEHFTNETICPDCGNLTSMPHDCPWCKTIEAPAIAKGDTHEHSNSHLYRDTGGVGTHLAILHPSTPLGDTDRTSRPQRQETTVDPPRVAGAGVESHQGREPLVGAPPAPAEAAQHTENHGAELPARATVVEDSRLDVSPAVSPTAVQVAPSLPPDETGYQHQGEVSTCVDKPGKSGTDKRARIKPQKPIPIRPKAKVVEELVFTEDGRVLFAEWCSIFKAPVAPTKALIKAANWLAAPCATWAEILGISRTAVLKDMRGWAYANDANNYYKGKNGKPGRGVKLFDLEREFEGWQSAKEALHDEHEAPPAAESKIIQWKGRLMSEEQAYQQGYLGGWERYKDQVFPDGQHPLDILDETPRRVQIGARL